MEIIHRGKIKTMGKTGKKWLKRRKAVEPAIGHLVPDNRMQRCWLAGATGDALHALCCALGCNVRLVMRTVVRLGLTGFLLCLNLAAHLGRFIAGAPGMREKAHRGLPRMQGFTLVTVQRARLKLNFAGPTTYVSH